MRVVFGISEFYFRHSPVLGVYFYALALDGGTTHKVDDCVETPVADEVYKFAVSLNEECQ